MTQSDVEVRKCPVVFKTHKPGYHFCGYYDVSPVCAGGRRLLTHRVDDFLRMPQAEDEVEIGTWDLVDGSYTKLATTRAYNWQQGAKAQWLGPTFDREVLFNDRRGDGFVTRIVDVDTGAEREVAFPSYTVSPNGTEAIAVNMERTYFPRPSYSYQGVVKPEWDVPIHPDDGLFHLDLVTGRRERIVSTQAMVKRNHLSAMDTAVAHYLEHAMFNPDGSRFVFYHRWRLADGAAYTRAYVADPDGGNLVLLDDNGRFSHCGFRGPDALTAYAAKASRLHAMRRSGFLTSRVLPLALKVYRRLFPPESKVRKAVSASTYLHFDGLRPPGRELHPGFVWPSDGHCTWSPTDPDWMLTDTYEDEHSDRHLLLFQQSTGRVVEVGRFHAPPKTCATGWRCDLHPRFSRDGTQVIIDSMHENDERQVYVIDVSSVVG